MMRYDEVEKTSRSSYEDVQHTAQILHELYANLEEAEKLLEEAKRRRESLGQSIDESRTRLVDAVLRLMANN